MKKVWLSSLIHDQKNIQDIMLGLKPYKVEVDGQFWVDDLTKMAWANTHEQIIAQDIGLWIIISDNVSLAKNSIRNGLAALALMVQADKGVGFPIMVLTTDGPIDASTFPTALQNAQILAFNTPSLPVKIVAKLNTPVINPDLGYRINFHPLRELGLWIEVGPTKPAEWSGVILGVDGAEINFQTLGDARNLPEHATLEYPKQGLKIKLGDTEFSAWAIQNKLDSSKSYFARITALPKQILFGAYTEEDETDVYVVKF
jgi:hypothetical protein